VVETSGGDGFRELHRMPGALDVGEILLFCPRLQVVDRGKMEEMLDLAFELLPVRCGYAEIGFRKIADNRNQLIFRGSVLLTQRVELFRRPAKD